MDRPNILFMICHDLGDWLGCYGHKTVNTPALDRLASEGVRFEQNYCTSPGCCPSRAALFTGRYPHAVGMYGLIHDGAEFRLHDDERHLCQYLKDVGYQTALIGDQHVHIDGGRRLGFDYEDPGKSEINPCCDQLVGKAIDYFEKVRDPKRPFFMQVATHEPHRPFEHKGCPPDDSRGVEVPPYLPDHEVVRDELKAFQGSAKRMDRCMGDIIEYVEKSDFGKNTVFIFTVDHGHDFPRAKATLYDPGIKVALVVKYPGWNATGGRVYREMISNIDVLPTILEGLGIAVPRNIQGKSFLPLLTGGAYKKREEVYATKTFHGLYDPKRAIRTEHYKYIVNFELGQRYELTNSPSYRICCTGRPYTGTQPMFELYDLEADPWEMNNLSEKAEYLAIEKELDRKLKNFMRESGDPLVNGPLVTKWYRKAVSREF